MARPYALVTMCATIASYLLLRAVDDGGKRAWAGYAVAVVFTGLFNTFGLLILPAHALTVLATVLTTGPRSRAWLRRTAVPWLVAAVVAGVVLGPLLVISFRERGQISWLSKPDVATIRTLLTDFAGSRLLILPMALLALIGILAGVIDGRLKRMSPAALALPWLIVPPVALLAVSMVKPVYNPRYVEFCLPALSLLVAAGLVGVARAMAATVASDGFGLGFVRGPLGRAAAAWVPSGVVMLAIVVLLVSPQHAIRQSSARPDNLRLASAIVAKYEQPGDVVFYLPYNMHVLGTGYPAPFRKLRDLAFDEGPIQSATLTGIELDNPAELASRFTDVRRVWIVTGQSDNKFPVPHTAMDREKMALVSHLHVLRRWQAGEVMLTLYGT
jgi:mannosyltransferase